MRFCGAVADPRAGVGKVQDALDHVSWPECKQIIKDGWRYISQLSGTSWSQTIRASTIVRAMYQKLVK